MRGVFLDWNSLDVGDLDPNLLKSILDDLELFSETKPSQLEERLVNAQVVITNKVVLDANVLSRARHLRLICVAATGYNNVDLSAARLRNIAVCNVRRYATASVVQHVFMLILDLYRRFVPYQQAVKSGAWSKSPQFCLLDYPLAELGGKTIGIIGYGELGQAVAEVARAFGMQVLVAKRNNVDDRNGRVILEELLRRADVISLHCPLTEENANLIGQRELAIMQSTALLINTARGGLIDESALAAALQEGRIAGAGLDVLSQEPPPVDHPLLTLNLPNLIITPHIAWASRESRQRLLDQLAENIQAFMAGRPQNLL